jgi:hypothetical protein
MTSLVSPVQFENAPAPRVVTASGSVTTVSDVQFENVESGIVVRPEGSAGSCVSEVQPLEHAGAHARQ